MDECEKALMEYFRQGQLIDEETQALISQIEAVEGKIAAVKALQESRSLTAPEEQARRED